MKTASTPRRITKIVRLPRSSPIFANPVPRSDRTPTPIGLKKSGPTIDTSDTRKEVRFPLFSVMGKFLRNGIKNRWQRMLGRYDPQDAAERTRRIFEEQGGLWIKVGQLIAMRNDIFSDELCLELSQLQSGADGFPFQKVRESIRKDFGKEIEQIFDSFDPVPFAAASISQVHMAKLKGKDAPVCVKILRPDAEHSFMRDVRAIKRAVGFMWVFRLGRELHLEEALYELETMVREELDFRYEASNMRRMRKSLKEHGIGVPKVYRKVCGQHTLVMEFVKGVLMSDFIELQRTNPKAHAKWCEENNVVPRKVATRLFVSALRQLFEDNQFHADIHPGNIMLQRDNRITLIDFGTIGTLQKSFLITYQSSLRAIAEKDFSKAADVAIQLTIAPPPVHRIVSLRKELIRSYREWDAQSALDGCDYHDRSMVSAGAASGKIMGKYGVQLTWDFMKISRTWATLDASISHLHPNADYMKLFRKYFAEAAARKRGLRKVLPAAARTMERVATTASEYEVSLGPALRRRMLMVSAAGQSAERFALTLVAFLRMLKWIFVVSVAVSILLLADTLWEDFVLFEKTIIDRTTAFVEKHGTFTVIAGFLFIPFIVRFFRQSIRILDPSK